jgi:hypothetical protein
VTPQEPRSAPDSAVCRAAAQLLEATSPPALVRHCHRTHALGLHLLGSAAAQVDREVVFVAAALHDLGLTAAGRLADVEGFEQVGAQEAEQLLLTHGATSEQAERAAQAVALHLEVSSGDDPRPEVAAVHLGAAADVLGLHLDEVPPQLLEAVLEQWPRDGFPALLAEAMQHEAQARPRSRAATLVRDAGLLELLDAAPLPR